MEKEKYVKLFKAIVGRDLTPQEFLQAKKSEFDPKEIKKIAGLMTETVSEPVPETLAPVADETVEAPVQKAENAVQPAFTSENTESQAKKKVPTKLVIAVVAVLLVAAGIFGLIKSRPVDVTKDIKVTFSGYDGYGKANYNSDKIHEVIAEKLAVKAGFSKAESHKLIAMDSLSDSDYLTNAKYRSKAEKLMKWTDELEISFDADEHLKNGDKVTLKIKPQKGVPLKAIDKTYEVKGLKKTKKVSGESLTKGEVTFSGYNGNGSVNYDESKFDLVSSDKSGTLSNGDELKFEFAKSYLDRLLTEGKAVTDKTFKVKVTDLKDMNEISKLDALYNKIPELVKEDYKDEAAGDYGSYDVTYKIEPQKSFIKISDDGYYADGPGLSLVITYKITQTTTWVKDDTWDKKKKGDVETEEIYTYFGYEDVEIYKDAVVLSDLYDISGSSWSKYLDMDAVYTKLEKDGYSEYQPKK
ncbi:hypothetical protein [Pseudolactococcus reticulitermitis]|uniref:Uncharacterized protein n=1 Tax=Pseudolactococcus reticulitermitis TaxID=2025039 RepID=A0A224X7Z4_9LACT|nr:hypothetical protein [Lactococcus reticulitermitis]GAX47460.1 hypothetical protein RsY01_1060 [Lactococcus reticulitermitis]